MKEFQIESFSSTHESGKTVKSRKDFTCQCCELTFPKGTIAQTFKYVNGTDFFEMKFSRKPLMVNLKIIGMATIH